MTSNALVAILVREVDRLKVELAEERTQVHHMKQQLQEQEQQLSELRKETTVRNQETNESTPANKRNQTDDENEKYKNTVAGSFFASLQLMNCLFVAFMETKDEHENETEKLLGLSGVDVDRGTAKLNEHIKEGLQQFRI